MHSFFWYKRYEKFLWYQNLNRVDRIKNQIYMEAPYFFFTQPTFCIMYISLVMD